MEEPKTASQSSQEQAPKNFYSLNLTEGRIFLIFVAILIVTAAIIFFVVLSLPKSNNATGELIVSENGADLAIVDEYYNNLDGEEPLLAEESSDTEKVDSVTLKGEDSDSSQGVTEDSQVKTDTLKPTIISEDSSVIRSSQLKDKSQPVATKQVSSETVTNRAPTKTVKSKETVTKTAPPVKVTKSYKKRYVIQISSCQDLGKLKEMEGYYKNVGYPTYIKNFSKDGKMFYRLRVGPFKEKNRAEKYLVALKGSKYGKESFISVGYF